MYVTFRKSGSKFLRNKTLAKTIVSKESFRKAVCEYTELKDLWKIRNTWADMLPTYLLPAVHYHTTRHQLTQTDSVEHSANIRVKN